MTTVYYKKHVTAVACGQVAIGFRFSADWLGKMARFFNQSQSAVKKDQIKLQVTVGHYRGLT